MIIDCCADLHGYYPKLEGGDLLIVAGDLTARDELVEHYAFGNWLKNQDYKKKVVIAGNHDNRLQKQGIVPSENYFYCSSYLCDSGTEFEGLKIWGSPWSLWFEGINPHCTAFTGSEEELREKFALIPKDTDILITHSPPYGIFDESIYGDICGSISLRDESFLRVQPKIHIFGHIHEEGGRIYKGEKTIFVNCSHVDHQYKPKNKPVRIDL